MGFLDHPSTTRRGRVAMSGSSRRPKSSAQLIAEARKERETRAKERGDAEAALRLQSVLRARWAFMTAMRPAILQRVHPGTAGSDLSMPVAGTSTASLNVFQVSLAASRCGTTLIDEHGVLLHVDPEYVRAVLANSFAEPIPHPTQCAKAAALVVGCMEAARRHGIPIDVEQLRARWSDAERMLQVIGDDEPAQVELCNRGFLRAISEILRETDSSIGDDADDTDTCICSLIHILLQQAGSFVWDHFVDEIMTVLESARRLRFEEHDKNTARQILAKMAGRDDYSGISDAKAVALLSNVLYIGKDFWNSHDQGSLWLPVSIIGALLNHLPISLTTSESDDEEDFDTMDVVPAFSNKPTAGQENAVVNAKEGTVAVKREVLQDLFHSLAEIVSTSNVGSLFSNAVTGGKCATARACRFFNELARRETRLLDPLKRALAFWRTNTSSPQRGSSPPRHILAQLWSFCNDRSTIQLQDGGEAILLTFVHAYAYLLLIQDDDDMFDTAWPFSRAEVREIATSLKQVMFHALYSSAFNTSGSSRASTDSYRQVANVVLQEPGLLDGISTLLSRLYACDSRHKFRTSEDFWIAGGIALTQDSFVRAAIESDMHAAGPEVVDDDLPFGFNEPIARAREHARASLPAGQTAGASELLRRAPYLAPFSSRAKVFHSWVHGERLRFGGGDIGGPGGRWITVRRDYLFEDAYDHLSTLKSDFKRAIRVKFIDEHGIQEAGIDGGGVYKEFMYEVLRKAFSPASYALFSATPDGHLYPNPYASLVDDIYERRLEFIGNLLAKALFDGVLVDIPLASFFLSKILRKPTQPSDLRSLDPELYRNLMYLRKCDLNEVESLGLYFVVANNAFGKVTEVPLCRGGESIPVTAENRIEYILRMSNYRMNIQLRKQTDAFVRGFSEVIRPEFVQLFSERELQLLISGSQSTVDLRDLERNTKYSGGYDENTDVIRWFWQAVHELDPEDQAKLLQFVTSSPRAPLLGFAYLNPAFCVHRAEDETRLPTASTCMNLLKLPHYSSLDLLREKLKYSLSAHSGFDLS